MILPWSHYGTPSNLGLDDVTARRKNARNLDHHGASQAHERSRSDGSKRATELSRFLVTFGGDVTASLLVLLVAGEHRILGRGARLARGMAPGCSWDRRS